LKAELILRDGIVEFVSENVEDETQMYNLLEFVGSKKKVLFEVLELTSKCCRFEIVNELGYLKQECYRVM